MDLVLGFGAFTPPASGSPVPTFPAASAVAYSETTADLAIWNAGSLSTGFSDPANGSNAVRVTYNTESSSAMGNFSIRGLPSTGAAFSYTSSTTYTASVFAKQIGTGGRYLRFGIYDASTGDLGVIYDLQTGAVGSSRAGGLTEISPGITSFGNGWYQCFFSTDSLSGAIDNVQLGPTAIDTSDFDAITTATVNDGVYLFRLQIVTGSDANG
jgi:hypothetical protein